MSKRNINFAKIYPWLLVIVGVIGLIAAFVLSLEKIELLKNPDYQASCNINPIFSCTSIMKTEQASAFGFPNAFIGLISFTLVLGTGVAMLAGATFKKWYWMLFNLGTLGGVIFVHWLIHESLYEIGALCLYCMVVWSITMPAFVYTTLWNLRSKNIVPPKALRPLAAFFDRHHFDMLVVWYVVVIGLILKRFWYFFGG